METTALKDQFLSTLFDALPQSVTWSVPVWEGQEIIDFEVRYANESGGMHIGMPRERLIGRRIFSDLPLEPETKNRVWQQYLQAYSAARKTDEIYYDPLHEKYIHVVHSRADEGILTLATDVTEGQRALNELRRQSEFTNGILDASINAVYTNQALRDEQGRITDFRIVQVNRRFEEIIGLPAANVLGRTVLEVFPNVRENGFFENACSVVESGRPWRETVRYEDSRMLGWFDVSVTRMQDGYVATFTDVTAMRQQQAEFESNSRKLEGILNAAQTRIIQVAPELSSGGQLTDGFILLANQAYADFKGCRPEELTGMRISEVFPQQHISLILEHYNQSWHSGEGSRFDLHCDDPGRIFWVEVKVARLDDSLLVTINDYTRLRLLQLELEQKVKELERSNRNLEEFAYAASHDLKEPIRKVRFFIDRLEGRYRPGAGSIEARDFERLHVSTGRMRDLVDDLLAYAQVSLRPQQLEEVPLSHILRNVQLDLELEIEQLQARVVFGELPLLRGHQRQLQQLFQNLVGNALKYHRPGVAPLIEVQARIVHGHETGALLGPEAAQRTYHLIEVSDNGIGFEQSEAERIFQVFQRLHGNSEYRGTGVGLSIARKVAENHGGFIYAEGRSGSGARFFLGLPL